ncbi:hypothetical protein F2P81_025016 [Scophthalmus maximus]|uniref:Uncharacterized protein n=1 Tax=Scophthalmus maximus TaxID=52904 RepID=A0A6A4RS80_SCOMX|nr:hypothetical protein F2P81_025016 [Scophthalmus maximus]
MAEDDWVVDGIRPGQSGDSPSLTVMISVVSRLMSTIFNCRGRPPGIVAAPVCEFLSMNIGHKQHQTSMHILHSLQNRRRLSRHKKSTG